MLTQVPPESGRSAQTGIEYDTGSEEAIVPTDMNLLTGTMLTSFEKHAFYCCCNSLCNDMINWLSAGNYFVNVGNVCSKKEVQ